MFDWNIEFIELIVFVSIKFFLFLSLKFREDGGEIVLRLVFIVFLFVIEEGSLLCVLLC